MEHTHVHAEFRMSHRMNESLHTLLPTPPRWPGQSLQRGVSSRRTSPGNEP